MVLVLDGSAGERGKEKATAVTYSPGKQFSPHDLKINGLKFVVTAVWG